MWCTGECSHGATVPANYLNEKLRAPGDRTVSRTRAWEALDRCSVRYWFTVGDEESYADGLQRYAYVTLALSRLSLYTAANSAAFAFYKSLGYVLFHPRQLGLV